jgi:uncharacterized protein
MGLYYFDASALVKHYIVEPGSTWVREIVDNLSPESNIKANAVFISETTIVEAAAAFSVLHRTERIRRRTRDKAYGDMNVHIENQLWAIIPVLSRDFREAARLTQRYPLKAGDALQLAVAVRYVQVLPESRQLLTFVSGDRTLLRAADAEGLVVDNPFDHVSPQDTPSS